MAPIGHGSLVFMRYWKQIIYLKNSFYEANSLSQGIATSGVYRSDGKWPDRISVVPWKNGKLIVWDATCTDTFAPSYTRSLDCF